MDDDKTDDADRPDRERANESAALLPTESNNTLASGIAMLARSRRDLDELLAKIR